MTSLVWRRAVTAVVVGCTLAGVGFAQDVVPSAPATQTTPVAKDPVFAPVNAKFFTAATPTVDTVNAFLKAQWGYDPNRVWSVVAVQQTAAAGVSKVVVAVGEKGQGDKVSQTVFFTLPDGKHALADAVIPFGTTPFAEAKAMLDAQATGPAEGAKSHALLLVEFADLQCPHCREAQASMNQLAADFPQARIVFESDPLVEIHPYAFRAAAEGACVRKAKGDDAFFTYTKAVFDLQAALTAESVDQTLATAATRAGAEPKAMAACAATPAAADEVNASTKLAADLGVESTPTLYLNGRPLPVSALPYEALKRIVVYQAAQDGVVLPSQPSLKALQ